MPTPNTLTRPKVLNHSPVLRYALVNAIIDALDTHQELSKQALASEEVQAGLIAALMGPGKLQEKLTGRVQL